MNSGVTTLPATAEHTNPSAKLSAYLELTKPKIVLLELVAVLIALHIATGYGAPGSPWSAALVLATAVGTGLVAASANALNQWIERERDAKMPRTKGRPLPSGRLSPDEALWFGTLSLALGASLLLTFTTPMATFVAVFTWFVYVALYTPMKTRTWLNTAVGAVSGATPLLIAWLCREDYTIAGYEMSTKLDPSGRWAGLQAVIGSAILLPVSLAPMVWGASSPIAYMIVVGLAGVAMLKSSAAFLADRNDALARRLMRVSLLYVPVWLVALWCCVG